MATPSDQDPPEPANLRFLRRLVTVLTAVMIFGVIAIVGLLVIRLGGGAEAPVVPEAIALPEGEQAEAVTQGRGWFAVVTTDEGGQQRIRIFGESGAPREVVEIQ